MRRNLTKPYLYVWRVLRLINRFVYVIYTHYEVREMGIRDFVIQIKNLIFILFFQNTTLNNHYS